MNKKNILLIVEGGKTEKRLFDKLFSFTKFDYDIFVFNTNIYTLYKKMEENNFDCDIKAVLKETHYKQNEEIDLDQKFAYTYLIFDLDAHHRETNEKEKPISDIVKNNIAKLEEMANYFDNETDPEKGKLYINFPMVESFKDCDSFFDESYENNEIEIEKLENYKSIVGKRKLSNIRIKDYSEDNFKDLIKMNLFKLNKIVNGKWNSLPIEEYYSISQMPVIVDKEKALEEDFNKISVLNTSLFVMLDYFGNKNGYYDSVVGEKTDTYLK